MSAQPPRPAARRRRTLRLLALLFGAGFALVLGEVAARLWVRLRWSAERIEQLTTHAPTRGRFQSHPNLPFALTPGWRDTNAQGFRGPAVALAKPAGVRRVACIGASTTYGLQVTAEEAYPAQLAALLTASHGPFEALNAGVPGWVSTEILTDFLLRVLAYEPDVVVVLEGRNEVVPQAYEQFAPDYRHYRRPGFNYTVSNYGHKLVFAWSRLAMLACTVGGERFGWSERDEHPLYGGIFWQNRPTLAAATQHLQDPARLQTWRRMLETVAAVAKARGITPVFCTMAFLPEKVALNEELPGGAELGPIYAAQVERNNAVMREVAAAHGVVLAEGAELRRHPEWFHDDCHMVAAGYRRRAELVHAALAPVLPVRR